MKINYIQGNIFNTNCNVIAHGCNAQGVMGSGIAAQIKTRYPDAYSKYIELYHKSELELGLVQIVQYSHKYIANCITQRFYGREDKRYVDYEAFANCMEKLNYICKDRNLTIAMPKIGAGLGGGNWDILEDIIEEKFVDVIPNVYVL